MQVDVSPSQVVKQFTERLLAEVEQIAYIADRKTGKGVGVPIMETKVNKFTEETGGGKRAAASGEKKP